MKSTGIVRKVDQLGRIVIPKELRTTMDIKESDPLEIFVDGDQIMLRKYAPGCVFCGSLKKIELISNSKYVCASCIEVIKA
jgi:transcriptional pleiotropic regulator of transition state genes